MTPLSLNYYDDRYGLGGPRYPRGYGRHAYPTR